MFEYLATTIFILAYQPLEMACRKVSIVGYIFIVIIRNSIIIIFK